MENAHFALDIGTRGVTGILYRRVGDQYQLLAAYTEEHADRAMQDGQIHDVSAVAQVISRVKARIERAAERSLTRVAVAAAGRALKTVETSAAAAVLGEACSSDLVDALKLDAVEAARSSLRDSLRLVQEESSPLHCVGYSVRACYLDGSPIGNLIGQRGQTARLTLIATFLPRVVIDSLDAALMQAGLTMQGLTLEPIAALNALVPPTMRKLNVALVDVGAGTSDIAITAEGTVLAYGMVPIAGDEVTDTLAQQFLLDFSTAESVKRSLQEQTRITFSDILGNTLTLSSKKIIQQLHPATAALADAIATEILRLNGRTPTAVMLIGGGAKTPALASLLAQALGLSADRVRIRSRESIGDVAGCEEELSGPESITPIGIAMAASYSQITPITVRSAEKSRRLFAFRPLTVADALTEAGYDPRSLKPRVGNALVIQVNGALHSLPGSLGTPGGIRLNGKPAELSDSLEAGDELSFTAALHGEDAQGTVADVTGKLPSLEVSLNGEELVIAPVLLVNERIAHPRTKLADGDSIEQRYPTVAETIETYLKWPRTHAPIPVYVNGAPHVLESPYYILDCVRSEHEAISAGLQIRARSHPFSPRVADALAAAKCERGLPVRVRLNGQLRALSSRGTLQKNGAPCDEHSPVEPNDHIVSACADNMASRAQLTMSAVAFQMRDLLRADALGKDRLILKVNGSDAEFSTPISDGDDVEIYWAKQRPDRVGHEGGGR